MKRSELIHQIIQKRSYLCIGLDSELERIPLQFLKFSDPVFAFNREIIDLTKDLCVAYKINTAFYECQGIKGWESLKKTLEYIPQSHFKIADAKRGDIGNSSFQYAKAFFETFPFDALTVSPYMGSDSIKPFLSYRDKWTIVLALTSNEGCKDFQFQISRQKFLYETVLTTVQKWGTPENLMFVIGALHGESIKHIRKLAPDHFFLIPGVGCQGGNLKEVSKMGFNKDIGLIINVSRAIIFSGNVKGFSFGVREAAEGIQDQMSTFLYEWESQDKGNINK